EGRSENGIAKFSAKDAARYGAYQAEIGRVADVLRGLVLAAPPNLALRNFGDSARQLGKLAAIGKRLWRDDAVTAAFGLLRKSAGDVLDGWFESDPIKAVLGFDAVVGNLASPYTPGSAYVLLHHVFGEVNGKRGAWGHAIGGMGAITQAMARAAGAHGVEIGLDAGVREVIVKHDRVMGVVLDNGETISAKYVASSVNPKLLYTRLLPADALPAEFLARIKNWRNGSGTFRMNVALSALPSFTALPGDGDHLTAGIIIAPSLGYMDRAWQDARTHGWSREPVIEVLVPSTLDDTLAPPGRQVASLFCQHVAPQLPDEKSWDEYREEVADLM